MKTRSRIRIDSLFPHLNDPAYQKLADLEELVANFIARRSTSAFKQRLQRGIAKLSEALVDYAGDEPGAAGEPVLVEALRNCRRIACAVHMLYRAGIFARRLAQAAFELVADIVQILIERLCETRGLEPPGLLRRPVLEPLEGDVTDEPEGGAPPLSS